MTTLLLFLMAAQAADARTSDREKAAVRVESELLQSKLSGLRIGPRAVALPDGSALIIGGGLNSIERFDPRTRKLSLLSVRLARRRLWPTVTLLTDGRVLIAGGGKGPDFGGTAEVYDPRTQTLGDLVRLECERMTHTATVLPDGRVLLAGGDATAEIFDPKTSTTTGPYPLTRPRRAHTATLLKNGNVLLAGGGGRASASSRSEGYRSMELFDASRLRGEAAGALMREERDEHVALLLPDGRVLLAGGQRVSDGKTHARSDLFDVQRASITPGPDLPTDGQDAQVTDLSHGRWLIIGGESDDGAGGKRDQIHDQITLFDAATMRFTVVGRLKIPRDDFAACRLRDGRILVAGGLTRGDIPTFTTELLTVGANVGNSTPPRQ